MRNVSAFQPNGVKNFELASTGLFNDANLVSYWKLEGNSTDEKAANSGTDTSITYGNAYGKFGQGALFNGTSSKIAVGTFATPRTISAWVYKTATSGEDDVFTKWTAGNNHLVFGIDTNSRPFAFASGFAESFTSSTALTLNAWNHIVYVNKIDGTNSKIFLNGVEVATATGATLTTSANACVIGAGDGGTSNFFAGNIDDIAVFSDALTATEVGYLYSLGTTKAYYPLNGNPAGSLKDSLVASYRLEDVSDSFGSYTLTNTGSVPFNAGKINNGADFTPNDSLNNNSVLAATSYPRSFAGWAKLDTITGSDRAIFALGDGSIHYYTLAVRDSDDHIIFRSNNNTDVGDVDTGITASTGTWYHWVVVQNSATSVTIYINNTATNTAATTFTATVSQFYLGYLGRSSALYYDGIIDEVGIWNRALTADEISRLYNAGNGQQLETRALDYSGNGNHGTETAITYTQGRFGQGARFNGSSSFINCGTSTNLRFTPAVTQVVWFKNTMSGTSGYFLAGKWSNNTGGWISYGMYMNNGSAGNLFWRVKTASGVTFSDISVNSLKINDNQWHCAIGTYDTGVQKLYLDGRLIGSGGSGTLIYYDSDFNFLVGAGCNGGLGNDVFYNGSIDEVIIESRAWTAKEVETYYRKSTLNYRKSFFAAIFSYILSVTKASVAITPKTIALGQAIKVSKTNVSITAKVVSLIFRGWRNMTKNVSTWTNPSKNSSTWTNDSKNSSTWTNTPKN